MHTQEREKINNAWVLLIKGVENRKTSTKFVHRSQTQDDILSIIDSNLGPKVKNYEIDFDLNCQL